MQLRIAISTCLCLTTLAAGSGVEAGDSEDIHVRLARLEQEVAELRAFAAPQPQSPASSDYRAIFEEDDNPNESNGTKQLEERIQKLEDELKEQATEEEEAKAERASKPTVQWTGRVHADYWAFPHTSPGANALETGDADVSVQDRFLFRRLRIGVQGDIPNNMLYKLEVDFNSPNNPQLKDNYIGWEELPWLQTVLVGNQKRPYGLDHLNSSRYNVFLERPDIVEAFNQDARRFGICSYGFTDDLAFNWRYGAYMSQDIQNLGVATATPIVEDYQAELAGRLASTLWYDESSGGRGYAHLGISGTTASTDPTAPSTSTARFQSRVEARTSQRWLDTGVIAGADHYDLLGLEGVLNLGALQFVGEYEQVWMNRIGGFDDVHFQGGYVYISYFLTGEHMAWDREMGILDRVQPFENFWLVDTCDDGLAAGWGAWQTAVRFSHADLSDVDVNGGVANEVTFGLNWYWNAYAKMQFNAIYGEIADRRPMDGFTDAHFTILGTRFICDF